MQQIAPDKLREEIAFRLRQKHREAARRATLTQAKRHDLAVEIISTVVVDLLKERGYRVVQPSPVAQINARTGHGAPAMPGSWGIDEPEP